MEGPSLRLTEEQLEPFIGKHVLNVAGSSNVDQARLQRQVVRDIFAWGKHLIIQFDGFALKTHFLMFGTYEADVDGRTVTGDYKRARTPKLLLSFANGELRSYSCSVKFLVRANVRSSYDFSIDIMARGWNAAKA